MGKECAIRILPGTELAGAAEDVGQHLLGEFASRGILLAGMVGSHQNRLPRPGAVLEIVTEVKGRAAGNGASRFQDVEVVIERDFAEGDYHLELCQ